MTFLPANDLEEKLLAAQEGRIPGDELLRALMESQLFMPIEEKHAIAGLQSSDKAQPLVLKNEDGGAALALFTSPERGKAFLEAYPNYRGGLVAEFTWILDRIGADIGVSLNPGAEVGIDMEPEMLQELLSQSES
jgi:hypothetical protein